MKSKLSLLLLLGLNVVSCVQGGADNARERRETERDRNLAAVRAIIARRQAERQAEQNAARANQVAAVRGVAAIDNAVVQAVAPAAVPLTQPPSIKQQHKNARFIRQNLPNHPYNQNLFPDGENQA